jgi:chromosome segregation ATPase
MAELRRLKQDMAFRMDVEDSQLQRLRRETRDAQDALDRLLEKRLAVDAAKRKEDAELSTQTQERSRLENDVAALQQSASLRKEKISSAKADLAALEQQLGQRRLDIDTSMSEQHRLSVALDGLRATIAREEKTRDEGLSHKQTTLSQLTDALHAKELQLKVDRPTHFTESKTIDIHTYTRI